MLKAPVIFLLVLLFFGVAPNQGPYLFSSEIEKRFLSDSINRGIGSAATHYSFIGEYKKALEVYDQSFEGYPQLKKEDSAYFQTFHPVNAIEFIGEKARENKVIIINEAHHQPRHRVFSHALLKTLKEAGVTHIGLETLNDSSINERGYPRIQSGYYSREPQFGNMIRTTLKMDFELFVYEAFSLFGNDSIKNRGKAREILQAQNIKRVMDQNPDGKFFIHCGYDHIKESKTPNWGKAMAGRLKEFTGIDPFTINQTQFTERSNKFTARNNQNKENPYYRWISGIDESSVFVNDKGLVFNGFRPDLNYHLYDCRVYHPRSNLLRVDRIGY